jgi:hypothetical protein
VIAVAQDDSPNNVGSEELMERIPVSLAKQEVAANEAGLGQTRVLFPRNS